MTIQRIKGEHVNCVLEQHENNTWTATDIQLNDARNVNFNVTITQEEKERQYFALPLYISNPAIHAGVFAAVVNTVENHFTFTETQTKAKKKCPTTSKTKTQK